MESLTLQQSVLTEHWVFNYTVVNLLFPPSESKSIVYKLNEWDWTEGTNICFWAPNDVHILCFHWVSASCSGTTPLLMHLQPSPLQNWVTCYCFLCVHLFICFLMRRTDELIIIIQAKATDPNPEHTNSPDGFHMSALCFFQTEQGSATFTGQRATRAIAATKWNLSVAAKRKKITITFENQESYIKMTIFIFSNKMNYLIYK